MKKKERAINPQITSIFHTILVTDTTELMPPTF